MAFSIQHCPSCEAPLSPRGAFCPSCATQAKCRNCDELLEPSALACVVCGTHLSDQTLHSSANGQSSPITELLLYETKSTRRLEVRATDASIASLAIPLSGMLIDRLGQASRPRPMVSSDQQVTELTDPQQLMLTEPLSADDSKPVVIEAESRLTSDRPNTLLHGLFKQDGPDWRLMRPDLKVSSAAGYYRRLACVFVAYRALQRLEWVPKPEVSQLLRDTDVLDGNARAWLNKNDLLIEGNEGLCLSPGGDSEVDHALQDLNESTKTGTWTPASRPATRSTIKVEEPSGDATPKATSEGSKNGSPEAWAKKWRQKRPQSAPEPQLLLRERPAGDVGVAALWAIEQATDKEDITVGRDRIAKFAELAFSVKREGKTIEVALKRKAKSDGHVVPVKGFGFRLAPIGREYAGQLLSKSANPSGAA